MVKKTQTTKGEKKMNKHIKQLIETLDPQNADYILHDEEITREFDNAERYAKLGCHELALHSWKKGKKLALEYSDRLTPYNVRVGEGVTICAGDDRTAATITNVTEDCITVRTDHAYPRVPQESEKYVYRPDRKGRTYVFRWSDAACCYSLSLATLEKGRSERH